MSSHLIVGLGNPGSAYEWTRHNFGFKVVRAYAEKHGFAFRSGLNGIADFAQREIQGNKIALILPMTYMNTSGQAVRLFMDYFKMPLECLMVVADDIALPFGRMRLRSEGSAGGHNGLKSIEEHLGTQGYPRLRMGIGDRLHGGLADYVLGQFTPEERTDLPSLIEKGVAVLEVWISEGILKATQAASIIKMEK